MMRISLRAEPQQQAGFTLIELLITLAIGVSITAISGVAMSSRLTASAVERAASLFAADFARARIEARARDRALILTVFDDGYRFAGVPERRFEPGVSAKWSGVVRGEQAFYGDVRFQGMAIQFKKGDHRATVTVSPVTGSVSIANTET